MAKNYKTVFLILVSPILVLASIVLMLVLNNLFFGDTHRIAALLETDLPSSATEIDYECSEGWDGSNGQLCAQISRADFLKIVQTIRSKGEFQKINLSSSEPEKSTFGNHRDLNCWASTNPDNPDTYRLITPDHDRIWLRYEKGKLFVVRNSS